jgi:hypothetical protein
MPAPAVSPRRVTTSGGINGASPPQWSSAVEVSGPADFLSENMAERAQGIVRLVTLGPRRPDVRQVWRTKKTNGKPVKYRIPVFPVPRCPVGDR